MQIQLLLSFVGLLLAYRTLSLLENLGVLSEFQTRNLLLVLSLPVLISMYFKEHLLANIIYIGIFSIILILSPQIIHFLRQKTFETVYLSVLQHILMSISHGHSPQTSVQSAFLSLNLFQKTCVQEFLTLFDANTDVFCSQPSFKVTFFAELKQILNSESQIGEQLVRFRRYLIIKKNLVHKSRQIRQHAQTQAIICLILYVFILLISLHYLGLELEDPAVVVSLFLIGAGFNIIFHLGRNRQWKT